MIKERLLHLSNLSIDPAHHVLWSRIEIALKRDRMPQALLLIGPSHVGVSVFANQLASALLCHASSTPCGQCDGCLLFKAGTHPDFRIIRPESDGGVIKIEQIRSLQDNIYQTPQCGNTMVVLIAHADKMNSASANALLKVLEEPPSYVHYVLTAEQLNVIPATIISRTQRMIFPDSCHDAFDYCALGQYYPPDSNRAILYAKRHDMSMALLDIIERRTSPCTVAAQWAEFQLVDVMWLIYLILAQVLQKRLCELKQDQTSADASITKLAVHLSPLMLHHHLDAVYAILKKLSHNIAMNVTLTLEHLLIPFCGT